jgi:outer membrane protein
MAIGIAGLVLLASADAFGQVRQLSLEQCLEIAINNSPQVGTSRERFRSTRSGVIRSYGSFLPDANLSMTAGHSFIGPTGSIAIDSQGRAVTPSGFDYESYSFSLSSNLSVFDWGVNVKQLSQAKHSADAALHDLRYQKDIITAVVIRSYYNYLRNQKLREVAAQSVEAAQRNLEQVEAFYSIGSNTKADVLQARVRLANTQLNLITARNNEALAKSKLASDMNFPMNEDFEIDRTISITPVETSLDKEVQYMLEHRADLQSYRSRIKATQDGLSASQNSRWPSLAAYFRYGWNDRKYPDDSNFFKSEYSWGIGVSLNFNLFDRFMTKADILSAKANARIAEYDLQTAKLDAVYEVQQLILSLKEASERMNLSEETVGQATENLRLAEERYRVGAGTILETIEAEVSLTEARANLIQAQCDYLIAKSDLLRATGREVRTY